MICTDPVYMNELGLVCALGRGKDAVAAGLLQGVSPGMAQSELWSPTKPALLGMVRGELPSNPLNAPRYQSRCNRLALLALDEIRSAVAMAMRRYGPDRIGVVVGTSTSGIAEAETAIAAQVKRGRLSPEFHYGQMELGTVAAFLAEVIGIHGPCYTVSTACTSGAKALGSGLRLIQSGVCDAVVAGGVDSLCQLTVAGFRALGAVSEQLCNPFSRNRNGINLGEGAALFLLTRDPAEVRLLSVGESSDGYHISAPDPSGSGARLAIENALKIAGLAASDIDYLNLHGTATVQNDAMESLVVNALFGASMPCSSTKPLTGHTLGAAGAVEAGLCWLLLSRFNPDRFLAPQIWDRLPDPALSPIALTEIAETAKGLRFVLSNSFAFGGSNSCVAMGKV